MRVVLGVCGGIAAYKAAELVRELQRRGCEVQVVMTAGAERFVTPLTFAALSGRQVLTSLWEPNGTGAVGSFEIEHIRVAQDAECVVIAPATANALARLAHGMADDLLSAICLASTAPLVLAPAMNVNMWRHPATVANLEVLRGRGARVVEPGAGYLACGMVGDGRLAEVREIADAVLAGRGELTGETVLITAGGTQEPVDAVRFLGNRSSGKMGVALAEAALARGARVVFVHANMSVAVPAGCEAIAVGTAAEMREACLLVLPRATVVLMAAAVADYRVAAPAPGKIKKRDGLVLELTQNVDILRELAARRVPGTVVVGFAAETERVVEEGRRKLVEKGVDAILANDVLGVFGTDVNAGVLVMREREVVVPRGSKREMAEVILGEVLRLRVGGDGGVGVQATATATADSLRE